MRLCAVTLPDVQGWRWTTEWCIEHRELVVQEKLDAVSAGHASFSHDEDDGGGWQYKCGPNGEWVDQAVAHASTAVQRRRFWIRERRRVLSKPIAEPSYTMDVEVDGSDNGIINHMQAMMMPTSHTENGTVQQQQQQVPLKALEAVPLQNKAGLVLLVNLLCVSLRGAKLVHSKLKALHLLRLMTEHVDDSVRLQRVLPYAVSLASDASAAVRAAALRTIVQAATNVVDFPPSDAKLFPEYILPSLSLLPKDSEELVRVEYATSLSSLCQKAHFFLTQAQLNDTQSSK